MDRSERGHSSVRFSRRALLAMAGITLVSACADPASLGSTASGQPQDPRSPSPEPNQPTAKAQTPVTTIKTPGAIALTIDDGPDPYWTPRILDVLAKHDVLATYCMIGYRVRDNAALVKRIAAAGHSIANHTWSHADLTTRTAKQIKGELSRTSAVIADSTSQKPTWFRAPYGAWNREVLDWCAELELQPLSWSVDPQDWKSPGQKEIVSTIMSDSRAGSIILDHDGAGDRAATEAALNLVIPALKARGLKFATI